MRICVLTRWLGLACAAAAQEHKISVRKYVVPLYPAIARAANIDGEVKTILSLDLDGTVKTVVILSGHEMLKESTTASLLQWRFHCDDCSFAAGYQHEFRVNYCIDSTADSADPRFTIHFPDSITVIVHAPYAIGYGQTVAKTKRPWYLRWLGTWKQTSESFDRAIPSPVVHQPCV